MRPSLLALLLLASSAFGGERPNILVISIDALRPDHLSRYGYERATSPAIDRILAGGIEFTEARTPEPLTSPALCSMLLSVPPHIHGATRNGLPMRGPAPSLPLELRKAGYRSAAFVGSWVLADEATGLAAHFDRYEEVFDRKRWLGMVLDEGSAAGVSTAALRWIDRGSERPFFAWLHLTEPHAPYDMRWRFASRLGLEGTFLPSPVDRYDSEIAEADRAVEALVAQLARRGHAEQTILVITSDHGEAFGEHGERGHGRHLWETTLRIPLAISWPGRIAPRRIDSPALLTDLAPTLLGLLDLDVPSAFRGLDWSGVIAGEAPPSGRTLVFEAHRGAVVLPGDRDRSREAGLLEVATLRAGRKEILRVGDGIALGFDLARDPAEQRPLRLDGRSAVRSVSLEVRRALEAPRPETPALGAQLQRRLRSLGYLN